MADRRYRRKPVTYGEFNAAVDGWMNANNGEIPTYDQLVDALGGGSFTTIGKYLDRRFPLTPSTVIVKDMLAMDMARVVTTALEKQRVEDLKIIGRQEGNKNSLLRENGIMEEELDQAKSELEQAQGQIGELQAEKQALQHLHREERMANEQKLLELAKAAVRVEDCKDLRLQADKLLAQVAVLNADLEAARSAHAGESQRAATLAEELHQARTEIMKMSRELGKLSAARQAS